MSLRELFDLLLQGGGVGGRLSSQLDRPAGLQPGELDDLIWRLDPVRPPDIRYNAGRLECMRPQRIVQAPRRLRAACSGGRGSDPGRGRRISRPSVPAAG